MPVPGADKEKFGEMLSDVLRQISKAEHVKIGALQDEIAYEIGRESGSAIDYWKRGNIPSDHSELLLLTEFVAVRGRCDRNWTKEFLEAAAYPYVDSALDEMFPDDSGVETSAPAVEVANEDLRTEDSAAENTVQEEDVSPEEVADLVEAGAEPEGRTFLRRWELPLILVLLIAIGLFIWSYLDLGERTESGSATPTRCGIAEEMVFVEGGEFWMGSTLEEIQLFAESCPSRADDPNCSFNYFDDELDKTRVWVPSFCIDEHEVTNSQFQEFTEATSYITVAERRGTSEKWIDSRRDWQTVAGADWRHPNGPDTSIDGLDSHPVVQVSLADARAYCEWRDKRLPSDAEWEKAARGTDGRLRPWGDEWDPSRLNYYGVKPPRTRPVGSYPEGASPYGAHDMLGNVMEWVEVDSGAERRGGSWASIEVYLHAAWRNYEVPDDTRPTVGFRCAKDVAVPTE